MEEKTCSKCKTVKNLSDFTRKASTPDGYNYLCRVCSNADRIQRMTDEQRNIYRFRRHLSNARVRAEKDGTPFSLTEDDVPLRPQRCPCCRRIMKYDSLRDLCPTLDRIIASAGYVPGNVQWLCFRCNRLKSDATPQELVQVALFIQEVLNKLDEAS